MAQTAAIVVASGTSRRMGFDKLMAPLLGRPVLAHSLHTLAESSDIDLIIIVTDEERFRQLDLSSLGKPILRVDGGAERQDSVQNGLAALPAEVQWVAIHDGARPLITVQGISLVLAAAREAGAASLAHPITETLKRATADALVSASVSREQLWAMETPQCFQVTALREAYQAVLAEGLSVTDEVSVLQHLGKPILLVANPSPNPKVTFPSDLRLAAALCASETSE